jgi:hypothetical protein
MTSRPGSQRIAEYVIRRACAHLPGDLREERYREWTAEIPAILHDSDVPLGLLRFARALRYAAGTWAFSRRLARGSAARHVASPSAGGWANRSHRRALARPRLPDGTLFGIAAVLAWITILVAAGRGSPPPGTANGLASTAFVVIVFVPDVLALIAVIRFVRWLRRRSRHGPPQQGDSRK